jgi:hypothetical protein
MSDQSSSSNSNLPDASESEVKLEDKVYSDVLTKLRNLQEKSEKKEYRKNVLNNGAKYMGELIVIIEEHKDKMMSRQTASSINNGFNIFLEALGDIHANELFENDSAYAYETFYSYINLFNLSGMKNLLKRLHMKAFVKIFYQQFASVILHVIAVAVAYSKFTVADLIEPLDNQETLLLMLNFIKDELDPNSSFTYSTVTDLILAFLWNYADKTVVVPNLIKVGYPEAVLRWLSVTDK